MQIGMHKILEQIYMQFVSIDFDEYVELSEREQTIIDILCKHGYLCNIAGIIQLDTDEHTN